MPADLVWSVFGYGTVIAIFLLPLYFIGYQLRKIRCKESIEKAEKSDKFDIFSLTISGQREVTTGSYTSSISSVACYWDGSLGFPITFPADKSGISKIKNPVCSRLSPNGRPVRS